MEVCSNCNAQITCNCQKRVASDGKATCTVCAEFYEKELVQKRQAQVDQQRMYDNYLNARD